MSKTEFEKNHTSTDSMGTDSMERIFDHLNLLSSKQVIGQIFSLLKTQKTVIINFLYFASASMNGLFGGEKNSYAKALLDSDILLADGIAIRLLHFARKHPEISPLKILLQFHKYSTLALPNLNGTDFVPQLLESIPDQKGKLVLYGTLPEHIGKAVEYAKNRFHLHTEGIHGYRDFPMELLEGKEMIVLLVGRWSPRQELWIGSMLDVFEKRENMIVLWVGGLFDFWAGLEIRAPKWMRTIGIEWLWRVLTKPAKNLKKASVSLLFFYYLLFGLPKD